MLCRRGSLFNLLNPLALSSPGVCRILSTLVDVLWYPPASDFPWRLRVCSGAISCCSLCIAHADSISPQPCPLVGVVLLICFLMFVVSCRCFAAAFLPLFAVRICGRLPIAPLSSCCALCLVYALAGRVFFCGVSYSLCCCVPQAWAFVGRKVFRACVILVRMPR